MWQCLGDMLECIKKVESLPKMSLAFSKLRLMEWKTERLGRTRQTWGRHVLSIQEVLSIMVMCRV